MTTFGHDLVWWFVISTSDLSMVDHVRTPGSKTSPTC